VPVHPQVAELLLRAARSPLPPYHTVSPFVARRIYRETRAALSPEPPELAEVRLLATENFTLRVYRPVKNEKLPALVYFPGGGWTIGDIDTHDVLCRRLALGARCVVVSVDYRLAPEYRFPAAVDDCFAATRYVADNAARLNIGAIAVGGDSAGGNLAATVSLLARDAGGPSLAYQLLIYPATDQLGATSSHERNARGYLLTREAIEYFRRAYLPDEKDWLDWRASPLLAKDHASLPPALVITAGYDPLLDEGRAYAERLEAAGVQVEYREYADMVHGFILFGAVLDTANAAVADCCAALRGAFDKVTA
jgi:acetyl esterase